MKFHGYSTIPVLLLPFRIHHVLFLTLQIESSALKMNFWNPFARSYLMKSKSFDAAAPLPPLEDVDDAEDDVQVEIDREKNRFQII